MIRLQRNIYCYVIECLFKLNIKIQKKLQDIIIQMAFFVTMLVYFLNCGIFHFSFRMRNIIYISCFLVILFFLNNGKCRTVSFNLKILVPVYTLGIGCLIAGVFNKSLGYILYGIIFVLIFPFAILIVGSVKKRHIFYLLSHSSILFFYAIVMMSFLFAPLSSEPYASLFFDPNSLGLVSVYVMICALYLLKKENNTVVKKCMYYVSFFISLTFILLTRSRTAGLSFVIVLLLIIIFFYKLRKNLKEKLIIALSGLGVMLFVIFTLSNITTVVSKLNIGYNIENINSNSINYEENQDVKKDEKPNSKENGNVEKPLTVSETFNNVINDMLKRFNIEGNFSSGRINIWIATIQKLNFFGHDTELVDNTNYFHRPMYVHNGILQCWYSVGFVSVVGYIMLCIMSGWKALQVLLKSKEKTCEDFMCVSIISIFLLFSLFYSMYVPFSDPLSFAYYLMIICFAKKDSFLACS